MKLRTLIGSGERITRATLPFLVAGVALNVLFPTAFGVGGPPPALRAISIVVLIVGVVTWLWSAALVLTRVPRGELITTGPFSVVKHPLYTGVSLLVLPATGFLLDTWLGLLLGVVMYAASRRYAPAEEAALADRFGDEWDDYCSRV